MTLRSARPGDADALAELYRISFPSIIRTNAEWLDDVLPTPRRTWDDIIVAVDGSTLAGALILYPHEVFIGGRRLKSGGIGGVAVLPQFRRSGVSSLLMTEAFRRMKSSAQVLSMLHPFRHSFYARSGYGLIGEYHRLTADALSFPESPLAGQVRSFTESDLEPLAACYSDFAARNTCMIARTPDMWRYDINQQKKGEKQLYCFHENKAVTGYIIVTPHQHITVSEYVWNSPTAIRGLLGFLRLCAGSGRTISISQPRDGFLQTLLSDPVVLDVPPVDGLFPSGGDLGFGYMARIIDCENALKGRGYCPATGDVTFIITDPLVAENRRPTTLHCNGNGHTVDHTVCENTLRMDISIFSQLFCGYLPLTTALQTGQAAATGDTAFAAAAFAVAAPNCLDFF